MTENSNRPIRVRMAPSPTGPLHIGTARTTLFNWLFARHMGGTFILRIEDTDTERSKKEYENDLLKGLSWLGIDWDEGPIVGKSQIANGEAQNYKGEYGPYRQSERLPIYRKYLEQLLASGDAYYCYCTKEELEAQKQAMMAQGLPPKYNGHCRAVSRLENLESSRKPEVIRFKIPEVNVEFHDMIRGKVVFDAGLFGDIVIAKDLDTPLYNFAVVVDDELMQISHVIRGEDHISNTPKQILLSRTLGFQEPLFGHLPMILNPDRSKMSKRFGDTALSQYREKGYLPQAIVNFIALLGWHPKDDAEVLSMDELARQFDIARVQKAGAVFDQTKLDWLNREYLKTLSDQEIVALLMPLIESSGIGYQVSGKDDERLLLKMVAIERGRASTLRDFIEMGKLFFALPEYDASLLVWQKSPLSLPEIAAILKELLQTLKEMSDARFTRENLVFVVSEAVKDREKGQIFWPLRTALSGEKSSPDPIDIMDALGKEESIKRIEKAIEKIVNR